MNNSISACLIMKNEARTNEMFKNKTNIEVCLDSLSKFCDEIIIIDTGSTDNSIEIAKKYTNKIFSLIEDPFNFSNARNLSFSKATCNWILWQDMDDYYTEENIEKILQLKNNVLPNTSYKYFSWYYDYRHKDNKPSYVFARDRLVLNDKTVYWQYAIHEEMVVNGKHLMLEDIHTTHTCNTDNGYKYVEMFSNRIQNGIELKPREKYYYAGELFVLGRYDEAISILLDFEKDNYEGSYENKRAQDYLAKGYFYKQDYFNALEHYLKYLKYDMPTAEILYSIATCYVLLKRNKEAIFWYEIVIDDNYPKNNLTIEDSKRFKIKAGLQLCMLYYKIDINKSLKMNNYVLSLDPTNQIALGNLKFFIKKRDPQ